MSTCEIIIIGADHGIAAQNVSAYPSEVTRQMVLNLLAGGAAANVIANSMGIPIRIVDAGIAGEPIKHPQLVDRRVAPGTADFSIGPAMTKAQYQLATDHGNDITRSISSDAVCFGEIGIANTASASMIAHKIANIPLADLVGPGTGLDEAGIKHKHAVLSQSADRTPSKLDPQNALTEYGGFEITMMASAIRSAANRNRLVIVDGFIATAAAIAAIYIDASITNALVFAHRSGERGHDAMLDALNVTPLLDLDMRLGEGTGALLAWPIIKAAAAILNEMATFDSAGVSGKL